MDSIHTDPRSDARNHSGRISMNKLKTYKISGQIGTSKKVSELPRGRSFLRHVRTFVESELATQDPNFLQILGAANSKNQIEIRSNNLQTSWNLNQSFARTCRVFSQKIHTKRSKTSSQFSRNRSRTQERKDFGKSQNSRCSCMNSVADFPRYVCTCPSTESHEETRPKSQPTWRIESHTKFIRKW